jgi:hypothetical protein
MCGLYIDIGVVGKLPDKHILHDNLFYILRQLSIITWPNGHHWRLISYLYLGQTFEVLYFRISKYEDRTDLIVWKKNASLLAEGQ